MYDVYGIGNALVDIEYTVTVDQLTELSIDKGVMTLVDSARQQSVMSALQDNPQHRSCGGSAANSIIAVTQFGGSAFYSCRVANDHVGPFYFEDLLSHGVATNITHHNREDGVTGTCLVFVTPDADRTMNTHLGITEELATPDLVADAIGVSRYLYIEGYLAPSASARAAVREAKQVARNAGTAVALTLSDPNMVEYFRAELDEMLEGGVDLLFSNEAEARLMAGTESLHDAVDFLESLAKQFVVTRGPQGALVFDGKTLLDIPGVAVDAIDTVGAGDMFAGAFMYGICHGMDYAAAGALATHASAVLVTRYGPRMDTEQAQKILHSDA
jgi:sugar/nucleoside kinase (ribokinase family)